MHSSTVSRNTFIYYYNNERIVSKLKMSPVQYRTHSLAS
ncbi:IS3 family transposase [Pseudoruminococcus massiliensis]